MVPILPLRSGEGGSAGASTASKAGPTKEVPVKMDSRTRARCCTVLALTVAGLLCKSRGWSFSLGLGVPVGCVREGPGIRG